MKVRVGVAALATAGLALTATPARAVTRPTGPLALSSGAYFGGLINPNRSDPSSTPAEVTSL